MLESVSSLSQKKIAKETVSIVDVGDDVGLEGSGLIEVALELEHVEVPGGDDDVGLPIFECGVVQVLEH